MTVWVCSSGSEDEKQESEEVLSTVLVFLLLMPLGITFLVWKEATQLLLTLLIRPLAIRTEKKC